MEFQEASLKNWPDLKGLLVGGRLILDEGVKGGQGRYFTAEDEKEKTVVGCKVLHAAYAVSEDSLLRFQEEGRLLREFEHDNIVKGIDAGHQKGLHYIIMHHLEGETLTSYMRRAGLLPTRYVYRVMEGIASALVFFHERGYVHRDIKPSNVIWCKDHVARLIDLGTFWDEIDPNPRERELIMGTVQYMSPEQIAGNNDRIDHRSDCYSLGMAVLHLMSGKPPFPDREPKVVLTKQVTAYPEIGDDVKQRFSPNAIFIVRKMIEKYPNMRYQTPRELLEDIRSMDGEQKETVADPDTTVSHHRRFFDISVDPPTTQRHASHHEAAPIASAMLRAVNESSFGGITLEVGEVLFYESDTDDDVYVLRSGEVEILQGGKLLARSVEPGTLFGEMAALLGEPRSATIRARTKTQFVVLTRATYLNLLKSDPDLAITTAKVLGERLSRTNNRLVESLSKLSRLEKHILRLFARKKVEAFSAEQVKALQTQLLELLKD